MADIGRAAAGRSVVSQRRRTGGPRQNNGHGCFRRRLFLVHGATIRCAARRDSATTSGFTGGQKANPSYKEVSGGNTGHIEAVQVTYDLAKVSYEKLLEVYWRNVDPLDDGGQFCDRGHEYTTAIFYQNEEQKKLAEQSKSAIEKQLGRPVATVIRPATPFYAAEDYHQDYYLKNPLRYKYYRYSCGRDQRLEKLWGKKG